MGRERRSRGKGDVGLKEKIGRKQGEGMKGGREGGREMGVKRWQDRGNEEREIKVREIKEEGNTEEGRPRVKNKGERRRKEWHGENVEGR